MYFRDMATGKVVQVETILDDNNYVEIDEDEFLSSSNQDSIDGDTDVFPSVEVSPDGINSNDGDVAGNNQDGTKTLELVAADGSAMFAAGAASIDALGKFRCSQNLYVNGYYGQLMLDLATNNAPELNEVTNEKDPNGMQGLKIYGGGGAKQGAVIRGYDSNGEGSGLAFTGAGHDSMVIYEKDGTEISSVGMIAGGTLSTLFANVLSKNEFRLINSNGDIGITNEDQSQWILRLNKSSLNWTGGNSFPAIGRPVFNGSTGATIADLVNYEPLLNFTPVQQGTGIGQLTNVVKIGYNGQGRVLITIDATNHGAIVFDDNLNAGTLPIYGSTVSAAGLMTATHIVVNGVKDWGAGRISSMFMHATYVRGLVKDTGFVMDSGDRPKVEGVAGDSRVAVLQDLQNLSIILDEGCQFVYGGGDQCYVGIGFCNVLTVTND